MVGSIEFFVEKLAVLTACLFLLFVAWEDFRKFRVRNVSVLTLLVLYGIYATVRGDTQAILFDLYGGLLLFSLGVVFWFAKMMGAGDAKLFFAIGCWVSLQNLFGWSILLLLCSIVLFVLVRVPFPLGIRHIAVIGRLDELRRGKEVPYAVPISIATIITLFPNVFL